MSTEVQLTVTAPGSAEQTADHIYHSGPIVSTMTSTYDIHDFEETENICVQYQDILNMQFLIVLLFIWR